MKYDVKEKWRRLFKSPVRAVLILVVVALLVIPVAVQADLDATATPFAWDFDRSDFRNSQVRIPWDGSWVPFMEELPFDDAQVFVDPVDPDPDVIGDEYYVCGYDPVTETGGTVWAGLMVYGLSHEDVLPPGETGQGATGFSQSRNWSLVNCDRNGDGDWTNADYNDPLDPFFIQELVDDCETPGGYCEIIGQEDRIQTCNNNVCETEIVTTLLINLDLDCVDGMDPDPLIPFDTRGNLMLCFYAEGRTPTPEQQAWSAFMWSTPLQARLGPVGGDKTVSFTPGYITAVELASFDAAPQDGGVLLTWATASEVDNLGFNIYRADSQVGELIKINPNLIPSKNLGSSTGAAYSYLDGSAVPGATYYYWLEDLDMSGASARHGPVAAQAGAAKALPGRPRPAPMPGNAF